MEATPNETTPREEVKPEPAPKGITAEREIEIAREIFKRAEVIITSDSNTESIWGELKDKIEVKNTENKSVYEHRRSHYKGQIFSEVKSAIKKQFSLTSSVNEMKEMPIEEVITMAYNQFAGQHADAVNLQKAVANLKDQLEAKVAEMEQIKADAEKSNKSGRIQLEFERIVTGLPLLVKPNRAVAQMVMSDLGNDYQISLNSKGELDIRTTENEMPWDSKTNSQLKPAQVIERWFAENDYIQNNNNKRTTEPAPRLNVPDTTNGKKTKAQLDAIDNAVKQAQTLKDNKK